MTVTEEDGLVCRLVWGEERAKDAPSPVLADVGAQLAAYFEGRLTMFDVEMSFPSSPFQHGVLESMMSIPYGSTKTYGDIADYVQGSAQAVGNACGANPIPILIPCHRVLGATSLGGFSGNGGVESKVFLLRLEGAAGLLI
ncbi:MAG: methylated-DNA--[protein]-cysteine S-methyltransferase [Alphaproteobacteria bacterium]|nr:methylated-DNA--[protein]-cysteine S-methyltransferase [Alphaproteobacteria bacterium]